MSDDATATDPHLLRAAELDDLSQITDEAARHALAHYTDEQWRDPAFAAILLNAARSLRAAGRLPSDAIVEAMERCTAAHRTWTAAMNEAEAAMAISAEVPPLDTINDEDVRPLRITVGLGDIMSTMLKAKRS